MSHELSRGRRKFVREAKAGTRQQLEVEEFRRNEQMAMAVIKKNCYRDQEVPDWSLIHRYWRMRHEYFGDEGSNGYKDALRSFRQELPENADVRLSAALGIISANFTRHSGR